jgi:hypothetical protein
MCLIMFSPNGKMPTRALFKQANEDNPDGIGIMSARGVERFNGKRKMRRAWNAAFALSLAGVPFAVHFRYATHGQPSPRLTHPFETADGVLVMHNGIINATAARSATWNKTHERDAEHSDTSMFVADYMHTCPRADEPMFNAWANLIEYAIGYGSKLCTFDPRTGQFSLFNESAGYWEDDGLWYSNLHSHAAYAYSYAYADSEVCYPGMGAAAFKAAHDTKPAILLPAPGADTGSGAMSAAMCDVGSNRFALTDELAPTAADFDNWDDRDDGTTCLDCGCELFTADYSSRQCADCRKREAELRDPESNGVLSLAEARQARVDALESGQSMADTLRAAYLKRGNGRHQ